MDKFLDILINQFLGQAPFLMGVIVFIGYKALGKSFSESISGFIKASVGFMILQVGSGGLVTTFSPILVSLRETYGIKGAVMDPYAGLSAATEALGSKVSYVGYTLLIGLLWNILLVLFSKWTKIRTLQVTGHVMFTQSTLILWYVYYVLGTPDAISILLAGILIGTYWSVFANLTLDFTNKITGGANFAIGHQQMFGLWIASKVAPLFNKNGEKKEGSDIKLPKWLEMFNDNVVAATVLMTIFFGGVMVVLGPDAFKNNKLAFPLFIYLTTAKFAVYLTIILTGVRMFVAELVTSFQGISGKILKNSVPSVDIAALYGFAPQSVPLLGFIGGAIGQLTGLILLFVTKSPIFLLPGFIPLFFDNAGIGVVANYFGGVKAAMILTFLSGLTQVLLGAVTYAMAGLANGLYANFDWITVIPGFMFVMKHGGVILTVVLIIALLAIPHLQDKRLKREQ